MNPWVVAHLDLGSDFDGSSNLLAAHVFLGDHRHVREIHGSQQGDHLWFRANSALVNDAIAIFSRIPGAEVYRVDERNRLVPIGKSVPVATQPDFDQWLSLAEFASVKLPNATRMKAWGQLPTNEVKTALRWVHRDTLVEPGGMLCRFKDWSAFVMCNFEHRWRSLRFARRSSHGEGEESEWDTLVVGAQLPSIPGIRLLCTEQILVPIPFHWFPAVPAQAIRKIHHLANEDWLLWRDESCMELIHDRELIAARRPSVRATGEMIT